RLLLVQPAQGRRAARAGEDVADAEALPADGRRPAQQRPPVPAQLPPRKLDGLSLLGRGTGAVATPSGPSGHLLIEGEGRWRTWRPPSPRWGGCLAKRGGWGERREDFPHAA